MENWSRSHGQLQLILSHRTTAGYDMALAGAPNQACSVGLKHELKSRVACASDQREPAEEISSVFQDALHFA